jgi:hypothetical protein
MEVSMIASELKDKVVYVALDGEFSGDDLFNEMKKWAVDQANEIDGYLLDIEKMTAHPAMEQKKAEGYNKRAGTQKPRAVIGKGEEGEKFLGRYVRFTKAEGIQFFYDRKEAEAWIHTQA